VSFYSLAQRCGKIRRSPGKVALLKEWHARPNARGMFLWRRDRVAAREWAGVPRWQRLSASGAARRAEE